VSFSSIRPENCKALAMRIAADFGSLYNPGGGFLTHGFATRARRCISKLILFLMWRRREAEGSR
jgi:hypothetical protein